jgi:hypothetical protein
VQAVKAAWDLIVPLLLALLVAMLTGLRALGQVAWRVGKDGHLSSADKTAIARAFFGPIFAVFHKVAFVKVDEDW